jgi:hypothetical protein
VECDQRESGDPHSAMSNRSARSGHQEGRSETVPEQMVVVRERRDRFGAERTGGRPGGEGATNEPSASIGMGVEALLVLVT